MRDPDRPFAVLAKDDPSGRFGPAQTVFRASQSSARPSDVAWAVTKLAQLLNRVIQRIKQRVNDTVKNK
ncbi:hypothetical protein NL676_004102 [Syzygium grande]|nr:hypothetical protein NL676_004102 [Syzygium grande]